MLTRHGETATLGFTYPFRDLREVALPVRDTYLFSLSVPELILICLEVCNPFCKCFRRGGLLYVRAPRSATASTRVDPRLRLCARRLIEISLN